MLLRMKEGLPTQSFPMAKGLCCTVHSIYATLYTEFAGVATGSSAICYVSTGLQTCRSA